MKKRKRSYPTGRGHRPLVTAEDARRIVKEAEVREQAQNPWPAHDWEDIWGSEDTR